MPKSKNSMATEAPASVSQATSTNQRDATMQRSGEQRYSRFVLSLLLFLLPRAIRHYFLSTPQTTHLTATTNPYQEVGAALHAADVQRQGTGVLFRRWPRARHPCVSTTTCSQDGDGKICQIFNREPRHITRIVGRCVCPENMLDSSLTHFEIVGCSSNVLFRLVVSNSARSKVREKSGKQQCLCVVGWMVIVSLALCCSVPLSWKNVRDWRTGGSFWLTRLVRSSMTSETVW